MNARVQFIAADAPPLRLDYATGMAADALGNVRFVGRGPSAQSTQPATSIATTTPRSLIIDPALPLLSPAATCVEVLGQQATLHHDAELGIDYTHDDAFLMARLSLPEGAHDDITDIAFEAYRRLRRFNARSGFGNVARIWNYLDDINLGADDQERYRRFCTGRAHGWATQNCITFPAATAIGRPQANGHLLVYWLACRQPVMALENPRQVSAFNYPRQYGPTPPSFARASLLQNGLLMISGTAAIVGHQSQHPHDAVAQMHETINNLEALIAHARESAPNLPAELGTHTLLKLYLRSAEDLPKIQAVLHERCPALTRVICLHADICRRELLLEADCVHGVASDAAADTHRSNATS